MIRRFSTASIQEIMNVPLNVVAGQVPDDMYGYVFINSACGTVNSNGLPYQRGHEEFGGPLISGDGLVLRFDLSEPGKVSVSTGLLKPPCYYADLATSRSNLPDVEKLKFRNIGLGRRSLILGARNQLSTAITPVKLGTGQKTRLFATFDAGRPYEFDPKNFKMITPIGKNEVWKTFLPFFINSPFPTVMTTAHPVFDPETKDLFTVNYGRKKKQSTLEYLLLKAYILHGDKLRDFLKRKLLGLNLNAQGDELTTRISKFYDDLQEFVILDHIRDLPIISRLIEKARLWVNGLTTRFLYSDNKMFLFKWSGAVDIKKWEVSDENDKPIFLNHNMHQIGFSRDYVVLCDTNFKFTFDTMLDLPFQNDPELGEFIRKLMSFPMKDHSYLYIIKRADLLDNVAKVKAKKIRIPVETVHFSVDYDNPNDLITIHAAHNSRACVAEWLREYDTMATDPSKRLPIDKVGLVAAGALDLGRVGKLVINMGIDGGVLDDTETKFLAKSGLVGDRVIDSHTWGIGLYTHRDILSPTRNPEKITHVFWQSYGLHEDHLSTFIYDLYKYNTRPQSYSAAEILDLTKKGAPMILHCVDTSDMSSTDFYAFEKEQYMWSPQFVPRKVRNNSVPEGKDGYILATVVTGEPVSVGSNEYSYNPEVWIFDANDLGRGPLVKLHQDLLSFGFTIHAVWVEEADSVTKPDYSIDIRQDYDYLINKIQKKKVREQVADLFNREVYPHFETT